MKTYKRIISSLFHSKLLVISFSLLCLSTNVRAQRYTHGVGLQSNHAFFNLAYSNAFLSYTRTAQISTPGITYKASLNFDLSEQITLSLTSYPFLGFMTNSDFGSFFSYEVPLFGEFHFKSGEGIEKFIGLGATYYDSKTWAVTPIIGPKIIAGLALPIKEKAVSFNLSFAFGLNKEKQSEEITYSKNSKSLLTAAFIYHFN